MTDADLSNGIGLKGTMALEHAARQGGRGSGMAIINYAITPYPEPARPISYLGSWGPDRLARAFSFPPKKPTTQGEYNVY
jgi:hypothetical protein